jgi:hypothetical protein
MDAVQRDLSSARQSIYAPAFAGKPMSRSREPVALLEVGVLSPRAYAKTRPARDPKIRKRSCDRRQLAPSLDAFRWTAGRAPASSSSSRAKLGVASHYLPEVIARRMPDAAHVVGSVTHRLQLDYTFPEVDISIDSGGDCKDFNAGILMDGHFVARDEYIGSFGLGTSPFAAPAGQLTPTGAYGGKGRRSASPLT